METRKIANIIRRISFILLALVVIAACKKDDDSPDQETPPAVNPMVGTYAFINATFDEPITVIVNGDTNQYQAGDDAYIFVGGGLLGAAPCDNADNAALQLRSDYTSWYVCQGESNEAQQGTWEPKSNNTILKLSIANPADFVVSIGDVDLSNNMLTGKILALPMPYDTSIPVGDPLPGGGINFQVAQVSVEFLRI
ncbi:MAG: hypothetical protein DRI97_00975 [Bacteroidetes bacterium]|nr:MAG: hypothetical protein DRI97_00975 [Bacteroidota bacterium]